MTIEECISSLSDEQLICLFENLHHHNQHETKKILAKAVDLNLMLFEAIDDRGIEDQIRVA